MNITKITALYTDVHMVGGVAASRTWLRRAA
ncbi:hypothetical protein QFZ52_003012 [Arthrobacter woluwensis]|jgi:hypothetical protein|nr:hypothetical protein [Arthrobacter woluwensis]